MKNRRILYENGTSKSPICFELRLTLFIVAKYLLNRYFYKNNITYLSNTLLLLFN